jgi:hypothetical protein
MKRRVVAFGVLRRQIACAVLRNRSLEHIEIHHMPEYLSLAPEGVHRFVAWITETFQPELCVMCTDADETERIAAIKAMLEAAVLQNSLPIRKLDESVLLEAFAIPALRAKRELELIGWSFWPFIDQKRHTPALIPALAALYVYAEWLLGN